MKKPAVLLSVGIVALYITVDAGAHPMSKDECTEGSDFIKTAALSRDNGMQGMTFLEKMLDDFQAIRSFPPQLRWLVQDREDEDYLIKAVTEVFENPQDPVEHQQNFFGDCLTRVVAKLARP